MVKMDFPGSGDVRLRFAFRSGGFIHGFRYTTRMVHRVLEQRNHGVAWPHRTYPITEIVPTMTKRINEASGMLSARYGAPALRGA